jgi:centromere/kinetochore protein ZW10
MHVNLAKHVIGLGMPQLAERVEKRMVALEERENIMTTGTAVTQEWDAAWDSDGESKEESSEGRNRHSVDEERRVNEVFSKSIPFWSIG